MPSACSRSGRARSRRPCRAKAAPASSQASASPRGRDPPAQAPAAACRISASSSIRPRQRSAAPVIPGPSDITRGQREPDKIGPDGRVIQRESQPGARVPRAGHGGERLSKLAAGLLDERARPRGPGREVAGAPAGEIPGGGAGGLLGAAEVVAVKAYQGQDAVRSSYNRLDLVRQLEACLELGDRLIPLPADEALEGKEPLVEEQGPADADLLADPHPGAERGPGLLGPAELDEDVSQGCADRIAVSEPARALVGQA